MWSKWKNAMLSDDQVDQNERIKYLEFVLQKVYGFEEDMKRRIKQGRMKQKEVSDIFCDKSIQIKLKGIFYKVVVRPTSMYGSEYQSVNMDM